MRRIGLVSAGLVLVGAACEMPPESRLEPDAGPEASGYLTIVWTGSIRGQVELCDCPPRPRGGVDRIATVVAREREAEPGAVVVDLGDFTGDPLEGEGPVDGAVERRVRGQVVLEGLGRIGYDAVVPGERDLRLGATRLSIWAAEAGVPLLATNLAWADANEPLGPQVLWAETPHGKLAILAVVAPLDGEHLAAAAEGHGRPVETLDPAVAVERALETVRPQAAFVVLLAHMPTAEAVELVARVPGIGLCLVAHDGDGPLSSPIEVGDTYVLTTGLRGDYVGRVHVNLDPEARFRLSGAAVEVVEDLERDDGVEPLIDSLASRLNEAQARYLGASDLRDDPTGAEYLGWTGCSSCHPSQAEAWQASSHVAAFQSLQRTAFHVEPACFPCHTTGFGYRTGFETGNATVLMRGVTCEACHGPGSGEAHDRPGYGRTDEATCLTCHTAVTDPTFDYPAAYEQVRHDPPFGLEGRPRL